MPDDKPKLSAEVIAKISAWIDDGAPYSEPLVAGKKPKRDASVVTAEDRQWWSFQPLKKVQAKSIDELLLKNAKGMSFNPPAQKNVLVRRLYLYLTGLPPSEASDKAALPDLIDKLLDSPRFGERWARHWLDVVRYADTAGENTDRPLPHAWRYRNWVMDAFNEDLPFDEFTRLQLAGDILRADADRKEWAEGIIATGYLAIARRFGHDIDKDMYLTYEDVIDNIGKNFLGLTLGCARCHDHNF